MNCLIIQKFLLYVLKITFICSLFISQVLRNDISGNRETTGNIISNNNVIYKDKY